MKEEMTYQDRAAAYAKIIDHYGDVSQVKKALEELGELIAALSRFDNQIYRTSKTKTKLEALDIEALDGALMLMQVVEEIADVTIMLEQLRLIFPINDDVKKVMKAKIERTLKRIKAEEMQ